MYFKYEIPVLVTDLRTESVVSLERLRREWASQEQISGAAHHACTDIAPLACTENKTKAKGSPHRPVDASSVVPSKSNGSEGTDLSLAGDALECHPGQSGRL
jgi:hypothetical protein